MLILHVDLVYHIMYKEYYFSFLPNILSALGNLFNMSGILNMSERENLK